MPKLTVSLPDGDVTHDLTEDQITIGRISDNMIQIEHASVSSHHAEMMMMGGDYRLKDLNSTNGTRVNGQTVTDVQLRDKDRIRFGQIECAYASEIASEAQPLPAAAAMSVMPATSSAKPSNFSNASPFKTKKKKTSSSGRAVMALSILAMLAFAGAVAKILMLQPPQ